jgi:hypothetical protein
MRSAGLWILVCAAFVSLKAEDQPKHVKAELPKPDADGWITLFNGKDLTGWDGLPGLWSVKDGSISGKAEKVKGNTFLVCDHSFKNFILELKFQMIKGDGFDGNSGIQYRSKVIDPSYWVMAGYQADMGQAYTGMLYEERGREILVGPKTEVVDKLKLEDWNSYRITADGPHLKHEINGKVTVDFTDTPHLDNSKCLFALEGLIGFQYHAPGKNFEVRFKDIRIKLLPDK